MKTKKRFVKHYDKGFMPWAHEKPDFNLVEMVEHWPVKPCKALEIGCGTGTDAIWLAQNGFDVTAVDAVEVPIRLAREKAEKSKTNVQFHVLDFLNENLDTTPFDFVFDRGYFHSYRTQSKRNRLAKRVAGVLVEGGLWLSLSGSCDSPPRQTGPPMRSAKNIVDAVEKYFEILLIKSGYFGNEQKNPAKIWVCLLKKRSSSPKT